MFVSCEAIAFVSFKDPNTAVAVLQAARSYLILDAASSLIFCPRWNASRLLLDVSNRYDAFTATVHEIKAGSSVTVDAAIDRPPI
eukprot:4423151-Amphidinium_carterae.1